MGRKSKLKKQRKEEQKKPQVIIDAPNKPAPMDPVLIEAYVKGRAVGREQGRAEGITEVITLYAEWMEDLETVPEIGEKRKAAIFQFFNDRMLEYIREKEKEAKNE
jgi:hypothetical protein